MVDALSGVSAVGPINPGHTIDSSLGGVQQNLSSPLEIAKTLANEASSLELSSTGQLIESVLGIHPPQSEPSVSLQPLVPIPPSLLGQASTKELAQSLHEAISNSGIFYESHLADWLSGLRSQAQIMQEPQAKLAPSTILNLGANSPRPSPELTQNAHSELASLPSGIHPQSVTILQHQLQSIDNQIIPWQGQIWPGQSMEWTVQPDIHPDEEQQQPTNASPIRWKSTLKLSLPNMGEVHAELSLGPQGCQIDLTTEPQQLSQIQNALPVLATRLQDAGIRAEQLRVKPKESDLEGNA
jgi:Flagellar hook-length control protein FliK